MNILVIDDYPVIRLGMKAFLERFHQDFDLFQASDLESALAVLSTQDIRLVICEINIGKSITDNVVGELRQCRSDLSILFYSSFPEHHYALPLLRAGADGFISKRSKPEELSRAITTVLQGRKYMSLEVHAWFFPCSGSNRKPFEQDFHRRLSVREKTVMRDLVRGKSNKEIAYGLNLKMNTISTYKMRILKKMEVANTLELSQRLWALSIE